MDIDYYLGGIFVKTEDFISTTNVNLIEIWPSILEEIAKNTSSISFDVWIKTLEIEDIKENVLVLSTPTKSSKTILQKKYKNLVIKSANKIYNCGVCDFYSIKESGFFSGKFFFTSCFFTFFQESRKTK